MKDNFVITISREYGSGGRDIGRLVAQKLGIPVYDKEIIMKAAESSGLDPDYIKNEEQKITNSPMFSYTRIGYAGANNYAMSDQIYIAQSRAIREFAGEGPCVIIGRCADFILKGEKDCLNIFVHADKLFKVNRLIEKYHITQAEAEKIIKESDKRRSRHYKFYTSYEWGDKDNYQICLNSAKIGIENAADMIVAIAEKLNENGN